MLFPQARILIFAKAPEAGRVKTRLVPALGADSAADLYLNLLRSTIHWIQAAEIAPLICCCAPDTEHKVFQQFSHDYHIALETQVGEDLGERMANAASRQLAANRPVVLIGGDCPVLQTRHLLQALDWLKQGCDAVIGPAEDGGYVLLGLNRLAPDLFRGIAWGSAGVLDETRRRLQRLDWCWQELETLWDLDRPEDLHRFQARSDQSLCDAERTADPRS
ncbi:MAG: TIGR04282 family arsenosugar biosynthesis glycosyltransferase [Gammaproteobacteria bacterium]|nr:TIGR04282 family arsenosugar biosynthesis glycosyltransferase [Gammaproteobacteria bacterium]